MSKKKSLIPVYNLIRLLAIALVVLGHSTYLTITTDFGGINWIRPENTSPLYSSVFFKVWLYLSAWVYRCHIPLFFMLSGSVYALNPAKSFKALVSKKAKRLLIAYFLCGLFFMIPLKTLGGFYQVENLPSVILAFMTGKETGHLWFLISLFWCFLLFYGMKKYLKKEILILACSFLLYLFHNEIPINLFEFAFSSQYAFFFTLGFILEKIRPRLENKKVLNVCLFSALLWLNIQDTQHHFLFPCLFMIAGACLFYAFSFMICSFFNTNRLEKASDKAFEVYLFHDPLMVGLLYLLMDNNALTSCFGTWIYFFSRTFGVVIVSVLIASILRKIIIAKKR